MLKSLESCGSFIVVDEELSTVHFAHSSIKRHLLSEPTDLDIRDYHIDPYEADISLGSTAVTYLCLDALSNQLIKTNGPSQSYAADVPSNVIKSVLPKHDIANRMALALLRGRKTNGNDPGKDLERSANLLREKNTQVREVFSFLPYCQEHWLHHSMNIHSSGNTRVFKLWKDLVNGTVATVELPWAPEKQADLGTQFLSWITKNFHAALVKKAIEELWANRFPEIRHHNFSSSDTGQLEELLNLLPNEDANVDARHELVLNLVQTGADPLIRAVYFGHEAVVRLALQQGLDVNAQDRSYGKALYATISTGNHTIVQLLIENGADVNLCSEGFSRTLSRAADFGNVAIIRMLLQAGANINALDDYHGNALSAAVVSGQLDAVSILLEAGAILSSIELADPNGKNLLLNAANDGNVEIVKLLLDYGASAEGTFDTEKQYMKKYGFSREIARLLLVGPPRQHPKQTKTPR